MDVETELTVACLPPAVERLALDILAHIRTHYQLGLKRKLECYFAIYHAYRELQLVCNDVELALLFGVVTDGNKMRTMTKKILKTYYRAGYPPPLTIYEPADYVPITCEAINMAHGDRPRILSLVGRVLERFPDLATVAPGIVAAGVVAFYANVVVGGKPVDAKVLLETVGINAKHVPILDRVVARAEETHMG